MTENNTDELVSVSQDRFEELERLEKSLPDMIQKAIADHKKESLRKLHERDKADPESVKLRVQRYIAKNRDKINERRREKRKQEKKKEILTRNTYSIIFDILPSSANDTIVNTSRSEPNTVLPINEPCILQNGITVRFDD